MCISIAFVIFYLSVRGRNNIKYIFIVTKQIAKHYMLHTAYGSEKYLSSVSLNSPHEKKYFKHKLHFWKKFVFYTSNNSLYDEKFLIKFVRLCSTWV